MAGDGLDSDSAPHGHAPGPLDGVLTAVLDLARAEDAEWIAVVGLDEFLAPRKRPEQLLVHALEEYRVAGADVVYVPWLLFGSKYTDEARLPEHQPPLPAGDAGVVARDGEDSRASPPSPPPFPPESLVDAYMFRTNMSRHARRPCSTCLCTVAERRHSLGDTLVSLLFAFGIDYLLSRCASHLNRK